MFVWEKKANQGHQHHTQSMYVKKERKNEQARCGIYQHKQQACGKRGIEYDMA
jgi:hypothetical protein